MGISTRRSIKIPTKTVIATAVVLLLTASTLAGCSSTAKTTTSVASTSNASTGSIGLLLPDNITVRLTASDKPNFEAKVAELCPTCKMLYANADADAAKQLQQAESMLTQGVKVLVIDPVDGDAAAAIVAEAKAKNVPVVSYDRLINSADVSYYISFDNEKVGELQAQSLVDKLKSDGVKPGDGGILMVNGSPTDPNAAQFKAGAHKIIDASGYKVLAEFDTPGWDPVKAQDWVAGQITQFKNKIKAVYSAGDGTAVAVIAAFKAVNLHVPPVTGQDANLSAIQQILAGDQYMTVYKDFKPEAEKAAEVAVSLAKGESPQGDTTVKTKTGADIQSFLLVPVAVTLNNIESTVVAGGFYTASAICTADYAAACVKAGVK